MPLKIPFLDSFSPRSVRPGYTIMFQVGEIDLSSRIEKIQIINSMNTIYPIIYVKLNIDSKDIPLEQIYGQKNALLSIGYTDPSMSPLQEYSMDLMIVYKDDKFSLKRDDNLPDNQTQDPSTMICLAEKAIELMGTPVRKTVTFEQKKTPLDIVREIFKETKISFTDDISDINQNKNKVFQWTIPQKTSVIGCVRNLDKRCGIYDGPLFIYCDIEDGDPVISMWDLSKKITEEELYTVTMLSLGKENEDPPKNDNEHFYTREPLKVINKGTSNSMTRGMTHIISEKPRNTLFIHKIKNLNTVFKESGIGDGNNKELFFNELAKKRTTFHSKEISGSDDGKGNSYITSSLSAYMSNSSKIGIKLTGNLYLNTLLKIGRPVIIDPQVEEYKVYQGKYITFSSSITLFRAKSGNYSSEAELQYIRGNTEN